MESGLNHSESSETRWIESPQPSALERAPPNSQRTTRSTQRSRSPPG